MQIAIIGAGNVGKALATSFTGAGHHVTITSRDPEDSGAVAAATGARVGASNADAARTADVIVLAVPFSSVTAIAAEIAPTAEGKVVVDVTNRMTFGADGPEMDTATSNAEEIAALLPGARIVKAFNTLFASRQADPVTSSVRLDGFVAGDDAEARSLVLDLARSTGLDPVDVGPLVRSRQLEALAFLNIALNIENGGAWESGWKLVGAPVRPAVAA